MGSADIFPSCFHHITLMPFSGQGHFHYSQLSHSPSLGMFSLTHCSLQSNSITVVTLMMLTEHKLALTSFPSLTPLQQIPLHIPSAMSTAILLHLLLSFIHMTFTSWL